MMRMAIAVILALGFAVTLPVGDAEAKKPKKKQCVATALDGKKVSFKCKRKETCCFDYAINQGSCKKASEVCL
jgi:hypothetical protein